MPRQIYPTIIAMLVLLIGGGFYIDSINPLSDSVAPALLSDNNAESQAFLMPIAEPSYPIRDTNVANPNIDASSAVVFNTKSSKFLYSLNSRQELPVASLTKIMTAMAVLDNLSKDDIVIVPEEAIRVDGEKQTLYLNETITVGNLFTMMLVESSNDAAYALAYHGQKLGLDIVYKMNEKALKIGMRDTHFLDPAGLDDMGYSTAEDVLKMVRYSQNYPEIWKTLTQKEVDIPSLDGSIVHVTRNTNQLLGIIGNIVGGKTGYTDAAGGCMILLVYLPEKDDTIISVVLGSDQRFTDTQTLINWVSRAYKWN